jgi:hypothetical protein
MAASKPGSNRITDPSDLVGQTVRHYHVLSRLGAGGGGVVYRAEDLKLRRRLLRDGIAFSWNSGLGQD